MLGVGQLRALFTSVVLFMVDRSSGWSQRARAISSWSDRLAGLEARVVAGSPWGKRPAQGWIGSSSVHIPRDDTLIQGE